MQTTQYGVDTPDFPGGCALVFGGSGGLGRSIAGLLAKRGTDVVVTYRSNKDTAAGLVADIEQSTERAALALPCDVSNYEEVDRVVADVRDRFGRIHSLISATGLHFNTGPCVDFTREEFRSVVETDIIGFFNIAKAGVPALRDGGGGSVVALVTAAVQSTVPTDALSATPKAAVKQLIKQLASEEGRYGIRANAVGPGAIDAGMIHPMSESSATAALIERFVAGLPIKRMGLPAEIAEAVVFLASSKASYISGQTLAVDGGLSA